MTFREAIDGNPFYFVVGSLVTGFLAGVGAYQGALAFFGRDTVAHATLVQLEKTSVAAATMVELPNLQGMWKRDRDGATVQIVQTEREVSFSSEGPDFTHYLTGKYEPGVFRSTTIRRNVHNGCETRLVGFLKAIDTRHIQSVIESSDGKCDLPNTFSEDFVWTRQ